MAKAYSSDFRLRALKLIKQGKTQAEVSNLMDITVQTLCKWWKLYKSEGITEAKKPNFARKRKVNYKAVEKFVINYPDKTLSEIGNHFNLSDVGVLKIIRKLNITYKKTRTNRGEKGRFEKRISGNPRPNSKR